MLGADHRRMTAPRVGIPTCGGQAHGWRAGGRLAAPGARPGARLDPGTRLGTLLLLAGVIGTAVPLAHPVAQAAEWTVGGSVSQRLQAETNRELEDDGGSVYGATTALGIDVTAQTPTTRWLFETGASVGVFGGSGDTDGLSGVFPNFAAAVAHDGKYIDTGANFGIDLQPATFARTDEIGNAGGDATQLTLNLGANASMALDPRNDLSAGVNGRIVRFTSGTTSLDETTSYGGTLSWGHSLSAATGTSLSFGGRHFTSDDTESLSFDLSAGVSHMVNPRLSFDAGLGPSVTWTTRTDPGLRETEFSLGAVGDFGIDWQPRADTLISVALSHGLEPSEEGDLETTTALGAGLQRAINNWITGGVDLLLQYQRSAGGLGTGVDNAELTAALSPSLSFSLTREVSLRVSYSLRMGHEEGSDLAFSNGAFLTLTHAFDIFP